MLLRPGFYHDSEIANLHSSLIQTHHYQLDPKSSLRIARRPANNPNNEAYANHDMVIKCCNYGKGHSRWSFHSVNYPT